MTFFQYPTSNKNFEIPKKLIHGTTSKGVLSILRSKIQERGYNALGIQNPPSSRDFGDGFYCSLDNSICQNQVFIRAKSKADSFEDELVSPVIIGIQVNQQINKDSDLRCLYFDGRLEVDGLQWAEYIAFHRVMKDKKFCINDPCVGHPDIIIGPVADGNAITTYSHQAYNGDISIDKFYSVITQSNWFPDYKQYVFSQRAIKYLNPVLKL